MATTAPEQTPAAGPAALPPERPLRSVAAASWTALGALLLRDLVVVRKHFWEFVLRTVIQPFLLCFVFLYVFPQIGQAVGGQSAAASSAFATVLVAGVVGISVMFQGVQSIALNMAQEFGFTREIEDRVQAPCPLWLVAIAKVLTGAAQGILSAIIVLPTAAVVHAPGVHAHLSLHWWLIVTFLPIACVAMAGLGLVLGTDDRRLALAPDDRAHQPPHLRQRRHARRPHRGPPHAPVRHLPGRDRLWRDLPGHRPPQLPPPRPLLVPHQATFAR